MFYFRSLSLLFRRFPCRKPYRGFCSKVGTFREIVKSNAVQKYFDKLRDDGSGVDANGGEETFFINTLIAERTEVLSNILSLVELQSNSTDDEDFTKMLSEEQKELDRKLSEVEYRLLDALAPQLPNGNEVIVEITAGVGGKEAMLFARELRNMYVNYIDYKRWMTTGEDLDIAEIGGIRHCTLYVEGRDAFGRLRHESGVHRVQRVPATEKSGRIHTSTVTVAVFPQLQDVDIQIDDKDLIVETKRSSGAGGQHVNKTESAVRITHIPSGIVVDCQTDRSQIQNRKIALQKLAARLQAIRENELSSTMKESRKQQVGTSARSDKIRTYNYPQDRITDHRISRHLHNLPGFLQGDQLLDSLLDELVIFSEKERFQLFVLGLSEEGLVSS